ncbi:MAG: DegT/DnrJ/EryC1/StrS aminotransferase [Herbinix sp.]|nr:DegT/DnrJ/EryC1/StrS aminotransferase [Herbinix sp.]
MTSNYVYFPFVFDEKILGFDRDEVYNTLRKRNTFARNYFYPNTNHVECYKNQYNVADNPVAKYISD